MQAQTVVAVLGVLPFVALDAEKALLAASIRPIRA